MACIDLSDQEWKIIAPLLPNKPRSVTRADNRRVLNRIFCILRTGSPWRGLPDRYGSYTTAYNRFSRWAKLGFSCGYPKPWRPTRRNRCSSSTV